MVVYAKGRKVEKIRIYDKIYGASCWLLMFEYNNLKDQEYVSDDKDLEKAVREHAKAHDMAQFFGHGFTIPPHIKNEQEKDSFQNLVMEEFTKHDKVISDRSWEVVLSHGQSPVFCIENETFREKFDYVFSYIGENLSYFPQTITKRWHDAQNTTVERVKHQYISLKTLDDNSCEPFEEEIDDPYVSVLKHVRHEYRLLTRTYTDKWGEFKWGLYSKWCRLKSRGQSC